MCGVYIYNKAVDIDTTQTNPFSTKPISMQKHMDVAIQTKCVVMVFNYWITRHDAHS